MGRETAKREDSRRRKVLKQIGLGTLGITGVVGARPASALTRDGIETTQSFSLDIAIGNNRAFGGWEEFTDYHDIENDPLSGFDVQMTVWGGGNSTLLNQTAIIQSNRLESQESSGVEYADEPHVDYHGFMTGSLDGRYTLYGTVIDVSNERMATATADFTVR